MKRAGLMLLLLLTTALVLTACSSNKNRSDATRSSATVEDRTSTSESNAGALGDEDLVTTQGLNAQEALTPAALNDPDSPLAVRVIYFDYDSANIRSDFADTVASHAALLASNPSVSVTLEGHADERGSREYNLALGERRALAVLRQLVLLGASAGQINTVSYGEERPAVDGHDDQAYGLNRRVELVY